jgi:hypothetical protein
MEVLTISDIEDMSDVISSQGLSSAELRIFALNQTLDIAKAFIAVMWDRHRIEVMG